MPRPIINADECSACGICVDACEQGVLDIVNNAASAVNEDPCDACGDCMEECPMGAIEEIEED
ncbi:MAG: 4Fe-4S binding protein [Coriobacteriia bacterium]|nr:4Fe-4S binding protein [Coriobacteriia bacterium]